MPRKPKGSGDLLNTPEEFAAYMRDGSDFLNTEIDLGALSTGVMSLDAATGIGGVPYGSVIEFYGPPSSGKSTCALHTIAQAIKYGAAMYADFEGGWDSKYGAALGLTVNNPRFLLEQPNSLEDWVISSEKALKTGQCRLIVLDSLAQAITEAELKAEIGDSTVASKARVMSKAIQRLQPLLKKHCASLIIVNHEKVVIGGMKTFGPPPKTTPGGDAVKFAAQLRVQFKVIDTVKAKKVISDGTEYEGAIASKVKVKTIKNKKAEPFIEEVFYIIYGKGVSNALTLIKIALAHDIVVQSKAYFKFRNPYFSEEKSVMSLNNVLEYVENNPLVFEELFNACRAVVPSLTPAHMRDNAVDFSSSSVSLDSSDIFDEEDESEDNFIPDDVDTLLEV